MLFKKDFNIQIFIIFISIIFFIPFLGTIHLFDWDEINFAESAREMIYSGDYGRVQINYKPFWEKPPLFFWVQVLCMKIFGISEFAARLPNAICGIFSFLFIYDLGKKYFNQRVAILWVISFFGSILPSFYFRSGIIDPFFNLFIFLGIYFLFRANYEAGNKRKKFIFAGIWIGIAILTKGPVALLISLLCLIVYYATNRFKNIPFTHLFFFFLTAGLVSLIWFGPETIKNGPWFISEFIRYHIELLSTSQAGHGQPFYYHFIVLLLGCFPASIFALSFFRLKFQGEEKTEGSEFKKWLIILFFVVLILFSIVETKILHYSSLCYFSLTFFSAYLIDHYLQKNILFGLITITLILLLGIAYSAGIILLPNVGKMDISKFTNDVFIKASFSNPVAWDGYEFLIGIFYFCIILVGSYFIITKKLLNGVLILFLGTSIFLQLLLLFVFPKLEKYTQAGPIAFYESLKDKDCYLEVLGFKSYAHLFYSDKKPFTNKNSYSKQWLLFGEIDKPVYFVSKVGSSAEIFLVKDLIEIKKEYGFAYYKRLPPKTAP